MKISQKIFLLIIHKKNRPKIDGKSLARYLYPLTLSVDSTVKNIDNSLRKNGIARGYSTSICVARKKGRGIACEKSGAKSLDNFLTQCHVKERNEKHQKRKKERKD